MPKLLVCGLFLVASIFFAFVAYLCFDSARIERARPEMRTGIVLRFEGVNDPGALETARATLRARLKGAGASEIQVDARGTNDVLVAYRPLSGDESDAEAGLRLTRPARMRFLVHAEGENILGSSHSHEQQKLDDWRASHPGISPERFNALAPEAGGPVSGLCWCSPRRNPSSPTIDAPLIPLVEPKPEWRFGNRDLGHVGPGADQLGYPAVEFAMKPDRDGAFGDFTASIVNRQMAIVLDGEIITLATVNSRLSGQSQITGGRGGFTSSEVRGMITILRAGELPVEPMIVSTDHVTAARRPILIVIEVAAVLALLTSIALLVLCLRRLLKPALKPWESPSSEQADWSSPSSKG